MNALDPLTRLVPAGVRSLFAPGAVSAQAQRLAEILGVSTGELAAIRMGPRYHYRPFTLPKRDGRPRRVLAPSPALKTLQRRLLDNYLAQLPVHASATAFRAGYTIVYNARVHAFQTLIATADLRDFFESTSAARVRAFFAKQGWRGDELHTLLRLCVYRNGLPQGAPTSPALSNLVNVHLDHRLARLAARTQGAYTRYGDDLAFSWPSECIPLGFTNTVENILASAGYEIQPCKGWRINAIADRPTITGLVLTGNGGVRVPWPVRWRRWRLWLQSWWSADKELLARLRGYEGFIGMTKW